MDFYGIKLYVEQMALRYRNWLKITRTDYTNRDLVVDGLHTLVTIILAGMVILR